MKKITAVLLAAAMVLCMVSCGKPKETGAGEGETKTEAGTAEKTTKTADKESSEKPEGKDKDSGLSMENLKVGFAQLGLDGWRTAQTASMVEEAEKRGIEMVMTNCEQSAEKQLSDVEDLLAQGCNVIVIPPVDADAILPALDACREKNVPVFLVDRGANAVAGEDYVTCIVSDFVWEGEQCVKYLTSALSDKETIRVVEVQGTAGGTDVRDRHQGFINGVEAAGNIEIISDQCANWDRAQAQNVIENVIQSTGGEFDAIYCHNDEMALGATLALEAAGLTDIIVCGIDGQREAIQAIIDGRPLKAIATCSPLFGPKTFDTIEAYVNGEELEPLLINEDYLITPENAAEAIDKYAYN
ncbi:ABC transporter substrate-binding protein [Lacrimispora sp. NSJ-141]|uniref:ABC transporter substrate-binding protein n=1 Tax=Lientehia hominis TaxID=2897778 RepID=A0AAP2W9J8_9FIRM|nr:ABC transporter substrate-binding protein [Lientehia hominis]MCD2493361.1 ABC transporter substrate-binding protein [Lientehia hominis]